MLLLSDTHINADPDATNRTGTVNMAERLRRVMDDAVPVVGQGGSPMSMQKGDLRSFDFDFTILNGDAAHIDGQVADYHQLSGLLNPLQGDPSEHVFITLGNHDSRERFFEAFDSSRFTADIAPHRLTAVDRKLAHRHRDEYGLDWYLLDSLDIVDATPGSLGDAQLAWLDCELAQQADHPAVLVVHHPPLPLMEAGEKPWSLLDAETLFAVLANHRNVKAILCGHAHRWSRLERNGLPIVGLPPTSYVFREQDPLGYVVATHEGHTLRLTLRAMDGHPANGEVFTLALR